MSSHKPPAFHEGPKAAERFESLVRRIVSVSKTELDARQTEHNTKKAARQQPATKKR